MPTQETRQRLYSLSKQLQQERQLRRNAQAQIAAMTATLRRLPRPQSSPIRGQYSGTRAQRDATGSGGGRSSSGRRSARWAAPRSGGLNGRESDRDDHFRGTNHTAWPPKKFLNGEVYYGRSWCDLTRSLEHKTHPPVDNVKEVGYFPRQTSSMTQAVVNYMCKVQSPYTRVPPKPGKPLARNSCDIVRAAASVEWSLRNRYPTPSKK